MIGIGHNSFQFIPIFSIIVAKPFIDFCMAQRTIKRSRKSEVLSAEQCYGNRVILALHTSKFCEVEPLWQGWEFTLWFSCESLVF